MTKYSGFAGITLAFKGVGGINPKYLVMAIYSGISKRYLFEKEHHTCFRYEHLSRVRL
jgi:hypothetical protein